jgi:hypothetical protein
MAGLVDDFGEQDCLHLNNFLVCHPQDFPQHMKHPPPCLKYSFKAYAPLQTRRRESVGEVRVRGLAQLVEHRSPKPRVVGSSPSAPATRR